MEITTHKLNFKPSVTNSLLAKGIHSRIPKVGGVLKQAAKEIQQEIINTTNKTRLVNALADWQRSLRLVLSKRTSGKF